MDDTIQQPSISSVEGSTDLPTGQNYPEQSLPKKHRWVKWFLIFLPIIILVIAGLYFFNLSRQDKASNNPTATNKTSAKQAIEVATRTYFKNNKPFASIKEESKRNSDGFLETIVTKDGKKLSHHLFLKDKILSLNNGILTQQNFKIPAKEISYKTTGENFLNQIKQTPNLPKETINLNGEKVTIYTIEDLRKSSFEIVKNVYAQASIPGVTKIYISEADGELKKVESIEPATNQVSEEILYEDGPSEVPQPLVPVPLEPQENLAPVPLIEELKKEATEVKEIVIDTSVPISPTSEPMILFPLSIIPTGSGYNTAYVDVVSKAFRIQELSEKALRETGQFDPQEFVLKNIKVRVDGTEIDYQNFNISVDVLYANVPDETTGFVRFAIPVGLQPGYHTIEIFAVDTWYLVPYLMVALLPPDEGVLNLELNSEIPPTASALPNNQGYRIVLSGENLIKPFSVTLTNTQGKKFQLDDNSVEVNGTKELVFTLPSSFETGIYSLTITKGSQTIYRPNYIAVSK